MSLRPRLAAFAFSATALLAGCASMSGITPHATLRDSNSLEARQALASASVSKSAWPKTDWWRSFNDPQLDALIDEALASSPTLNIPAARTRKGLAVAHTSKAALLPRVDGTPTSTPQGY